MEGGGITKCANVLDNSDQSVYFFLLPKWGQWGGAMSLKQKRETIDNR